MGYKPHQTDSWQPEASIHIRNIRRLIGSKLNQYTISTRKADVTICSRVLAITFTKYNREFCSSLWDPGGQNCKCIKYRNRWRCFYRLHVVQIDLVSG
jgi:hypothetical protein